MTVTDEMVEKARPALRYWMTTNEMRAALDAVEPMIAAQTMLEAAELIEGLYLNSRGHILDADTLDACIDALNARAQELDPK